MHILDLAVCSEATLSNSYCPFVWGEQLIPLRLWADYAVCRFQRRGRIPEHPPLETLMTTLLSNRQKSDADTALVNKCLGPAAAGDHTLAIKTYRQITGCSQATEPHALNLTAEVSY